MERKEDRRVEQETPGPAPETSSVATHRRGERMRTYVQPPRNEARM